MRVKLDSNWLADTNLFGVHVLSPTILWDRPHMLIRQRAHAEQDHSHSIPGQVLGGNPTYVDGQ
jgi:hypothetical protein